VAYAVALGGPHAVGSLPLHKAAGVLCSTRWCESSAPPGGAIPPLHQAVRVLRSAPPGGASPPLHKHLRTRVCNWRVRGNVANGGKANGRFRPSVQQSVASRGARVVRQRVATYFRSVWCCNLCTHTILQQRPLAKCQKAVRHNPNHSYHPSFIEDRKHLARGGKTESTSHVAERPQAPRTWRRDRKHLARG
jgi:hypothetical protein